MDAQAMEEGLLCAELNAQKENRIESPLVRYNESDQPVCWVCNVILKSESLWDAHQVSCKHHETLCRLRAAIFGASTGLVSKTSMIIVVGPVEQDTMAMIISGFLAFVFLACSIATADVVSMSSQLDRKSKSWLNILDAIIVQVLAFVIGVMVPSFATSLIRKYKMGLGVVVATTSFALVVFGWLWAVLGKAPVWKFVIMFLVGGWIFMVLPLGLNMFGKVDF